MTRRQKVLVEVAAFTLIVLVLATLAFLYWALSWYGPIALIVGATLMAGLTFLLVRRIDPNYLSREIQRERDRWRRGQGPPAPPVTSPY